MLQLAQAARYAVSAGSTGLSGAAGVLSPDGTQLTTTGGEIKWDEQVKVSNFTGALSLTYGNKTVDLDFGELDAYNNAEELAKGIQDKLADTYITTSSGDYVKANTLIGVSVDGGRISFSDLKNAGNSVYISGASSSMKSVLGIEPGEEATSINVTYDTNPLSKEVDMATFLSGKTINVTLDGVTKKVTIGDLNEELRKAQDENTDPDVEPKLMDVLVKDMQKQLEKSFGAGKVTVGEKDGGLTFTTAKGSTLSVNSDAGERLGLGKYGLTSYMNTSRTLGDLGVLDGLESIHVDASKVTSKDGKYYDEAGNLVQKTADSPDDAPVYERVDANGNALYDLKVNGVSVGAFTKDTAFESVLTAINSNTEAGVNVSYSKITNQFVFTAKETGKAGDIDFGDSDLGVKLFGNTKDTSATAPGKFTNGQDAIFTATINGDPIEMTRSSNVVDLDGLSVTLQGTFGYERDADGKVQTNDDGSFKLTANTEAVTFTTKSDTEKIVGAIKSFIDDYNALVKEVHDAYATLPAQKSNGSGYSPLTDEDKASMSESAIEAYEEKVKQGLLFADNDLSTMYSRLRTAITPSGNDGATLRSIGITTKYEDGLTTLSLDENKMKEALESNPDKVKDIFTKTKEGGSATDGIMYNLKKTMDAYTSTSVATPGILVRRAGTKLSSLSLMDNTLQDQLDNLDKQIEKWQDKMSDRVDYYTRQFTALEQLMAQMNSQSSSLMSMMGGY